MANNAKRKVILVTGASGFVGRNFIERVKDQCIIYALARRSQEDAGVPSHSNILWQRCDISIEKNIRRTIDDIAAQGGVDFLFHFAGFYDFTNKDNPEYQLTNVDGTRYLLENAAKLNIKRFVFSSSLAVSDYTASDRALDEHSPLDASIPYARSKIAAEELIHEFSKQFPCTIVRLAAIFSDWCEYGPLYILLKNWLSGGVKAGFMPGKGETALPYLHVQDLSNLFSNIMKNHEQLSALDVIVASRDGCVSQNELFDIASRYYYGVKLTQHTIPVWLAWVGIFAMELMGKMTGKPPFERTWMLKYIDRKMEVDASSARRLLDFQPRRRFHITRRMLFLIENMKIHPNLWESRNLAMAIKKSEARPDLKIYEVMIENREEIVERHVRHLKDAANNEIYPTYSKMDPETLRIQANLIYEMLEVVFLQGNRLHILKYAKYLARKRSKDGIKLAELSAALQHTAENLKNSLLIHPALKGLRQKIHDEIGLTMQLLEDEIEDAYDYPEPIS